ncbi:MAG: hypothetical protein SPK47_01535, partial [Eubacteriales bacterium]|nr:hypothetical protein [Clostridiales bacterium]MDY5719945.1 hypothetical protein [Eubacteriales bacterium]
MKKSIRAILSVVFVLVLGATMLVACNKDKGEETPETHTYSQTWSYDSSEHWHQCTLDGHTDVADKAAHTYDNDADTTCNVCGYVRAAHTHAASAEWSKDATNHWHECTVSGCNEQLDKAAHTWDEGNVTTKATFTSDGVKMYTCTVCEKAKTETVTMEYIDVNFVKSDAEVQT